MYITHNFDETTQLGETLGAFLQAGDTVLLYGELGTGKSVLARGCARALGVNEAMASPTFTLMQPYEGNACPVYHFDLYRLSGEDELYYSGLEEKIATDGVALIEWPQQADVCPDKRIEIDIVRDGANTENRLIDIAVIGMEERRAAIESALATFRTEN